MRGSELVDPEEVSVNQPYLSVERAIEVREVAITTQTFWEVRVECVWFWGSSCPHCQRSEALASIGKRK